MFIYYCCKELVKLQKKFYLDTAIWRDYFEDRKDNIRPLGEFAFSFIKYCKEKKHAILYSEITLIELKDFQQELNEFFDSFECIVLKVSYSKEQAIEANNIEKQKNIPYNDALHAIIARDNNAVLITRDKHFEELQDIVEVMAPEEAISD